MAKSSYTKRRTGGKAGGRYTKKKVVGRVSKRSVGLERPEGSGDDEDEDRSGGPTAEQLARWQSAVVFEGGEPTWSEQASGRLQARYFAAEWRGSVLLDKQEFVDTMFDVLGAKGRDASFVLGVDVRKSRADYMVVVRLNSRLRWRDWRKKLMFGHGGEVEGEGLFVRLRVPLRGSAEGTKAFIEEMVGKCAVYDHKRSYNKADMLREHSKGYARPGRKRKAMEIDDA